MKKILLIATGGTIASKKTEKGLTPGLNPEDILKYVPRVRGLCEVEAVQLFNVDSTNMSPDRWITIAAKVKECFDDYDGFVILHGTDTMSYTAAALSYLIQNSRKPIVITGSQRPIEKERTDAVANVEDSFLYAVDEHSHGVCIVFGGRVIQGTRARKMRTKSFNAFDSMDFPYLAIIRDGKILRYIREDVCGEPRFYLELNKRVFLLKLIPGIKPDILSYLKKDYDALIVESFGVGGLPTYEGIGYEAALKDWIDSGRFLMMTTQVPHEGSDMSIYNVGMKYKEKYGLMESYDMTLEATVTKLMWILGRTRDKAEIKRLFYTPVSHDILF